ncbi:MAG: MBL fold metallo-hydrolase [Thermodesulfovibrionia bacterium]|nr:MBL fold metallo-hydrolase [Thermodesulfovibrionia bacterium]
MKKCSYLISLVSVLVFFVSAYGQEAPKREGLTKITDNIYSYVDVKKSSPQSSFGANAGIIIGKYGIVVIDTLTSSKEAKRFIKDMKSVSDKPIKYVINTHYHADHTFGNSDFAKLGATIISHAACKNTLKTNGEAALQNAQNYGLTEEDLAGTEIAYPVLTFQEKMEVDMGDQKIELIYFGPSHTDGSILVYMPDWKVLFTGDILFTNYHPFMADGDIGRWVKVLDYILTLDVNKIIPGHGPISDKKDVKDMKDYIIAFDKKAKELAAKSEDVEYITSEIKKSLPPRDEGDGLIPANIQMKYLKK